jgi:hypothetical protein
MLKFYFHATPNPTKVALLHWESSITGTDTYHHDTTYPSCLRLHECPRNFNP